ncbi:MAG: L,D-transpeptidase family protein [Candidatus Marinimicrobia bacterium]|nr:L,D-transpeptidase family protein [Candidatus Neomarinimicrobiota bacterium]
MPVEVIGNQKSRNIKMDLTIVRKFSYFWVILSLCLPIFCAKAIDTSPIPLSCRQIILILTDSLKATNGTLYYFERDCTKIEWILSNDKIPVVIGRSGLGWGIGLHDDTNILNFPIKEEGDGSSPAGVFNLSSVFGYKPTDQMLNIKMPYIHITEMIECIDDVTSKYYNKVVSREKIEKVENVDWQSSEKMNLAGIYYELGVIVDHNYDPIKKGAGSCIFLHNWANPNETTAGCTEMDPIKMREIVYWLDESKSPVLVQLTNQLYIDLIKQWELPKIFKIEKIYEP